MSHRCSFRSRMFARKKSLPFAKGALGLFAMTIWDLFTRRSLSRRERSFTEPFGVKEPLECYFAFSVVDFCLNVSVY